MIRVLYISNEDRELGGSSLSLLAMLEALKGQVLPLILFREEGPVAARFREAGYPVLILPFNRATFHAKGWERVLRFIPHALANAFVQRRCVHEAIRQCKGVSAVHGNSGTVDIGLKIARALDVPHIWHIREYLDLGLKTRPFPGWGRWYREIRESDAVIAITPGLFQHLHLEGHPNAFCIPDAVLPATDIALNPEKKPYVVFLAGKISPVKHPEEAIRVFSAANLDGFKLLLVGKIDNELEASLQAQADAAGTAVSFLPFTRDVKALLSDAAATLVCTDFEGMGRVAIEAMFYGCPVVAKASGGSADILENGKLGYLYTDETEAASQLRRAVGQPDISLLQAAQQAAISNYCLENYGQKILDVYQSVLKR